MDKSVLKVTLLASLLALFSSLGSYAQEYFMNSSTNGTTITTCSGILYDSGGELGSYQANEDYVVTICSDQEGTVMTLHFTEFELESTTFDWIIIYDGDSESSPIIISESGNSFLEGQTVSASGSCLTVKFKSDDSVNLSGFAADINCAFGCQNFAVNLLSATPNLLFPESSMTDLCIGDEITFEVTASFPENDLNYHQSLESLEWHWIIYDENYESEEVITGVTNNYTYACEDGGLIVVGFYAIDDNGCISGTNSTVYLRVPVKPDFSQSIVPAGVCLGEFITLHPLIQTDTVSFNQNTVGLFDTICFADLIGVWQTAEFLVNSGNLSDVITSASDIESVCINIEHSYVGDLDIRLVCPNGQSVILFGQACSLTYFGIPDQEDNCSPGIGWDYCWSMNALSPLSSNCNQGESFPAGSYLPVQDFSSLEGCPVNGLWKLEFMDNLGLDDGNVFYAEINFDDGIIQGGDNELLFVNLFDTSLNSSDVFWTGNNILPGVLYQEVISESIGDFNFLLTATDDFGCAFDTTFTVTVYDLGDPFCGTFCNSMFYETSTDTINDGSEVYPSQNNSVCDWLITQPSKTDTDYFCFWNSFDLYDGDVVRIYAGNSDAAPLLLEASAGYEPEAFVITGNEAYITYTTNGTLRSPGWELVYQTVPTGSLINSLGEVSIYPNPSNGIFNISGMTKPAKLSVIDMSGRIVMEVNDFKNSSLDIGNLQSGMYFIKIEGDGNQMHKILKQ